MAVHGDRELVRKDGVSLTYREVEARSAALARGLLAQGAGKGTRIGLLMPNGPDWIVSWLAIARIGAIAVTLSTFFAARELAYGLAHADVAILLTAPAYLKHDYLGRLEEAFPDLADREAAEPLILESAPYLRGIWVAGATAPAWARGTLAAMCPSDRHNESWPCARWRRSIAWPKAVAFPSTCRRRWAGTGRCAATTISASGARSCS